MQNILKNSGLVMVNSSNYNLWQYEQFQRYIGKNVLEIGCGLGNITQFLLNDSEYLLSVDVKPAAVEYARQRFAGNDKLNVEKLDLFSEGLGKYSNINFDTIVFSNVLEHIEDDLGAMKTCYELLRGKQGKLLLLVPAHGFLFGTLDKESGHYRRYTKKSILDLAEKSGFNIIDLYAFNFIGALGWFVNYCLLRRRNTNNETSASQVGFFDRILVKPSKFIESKLRPMIGLSYIAVLEAKS